MRCIRMRDTGLWRCAQLHKVRQCLVNGTGRCNGRSTNQAVSQHRSGTVRRRWRTAAPCSSPFGPYVSGTAAGVEAQWRPPYRRRQCVAHCLQERRKYAKARAAGDTVQEERYRRRRVEDGTGSWGKLPTMGARDVGRNQNGPGSVGHCPGLPR